MRSAEELRQIGRMLWDQSSYTPFSLADATAENLMAAADIIERLDVLIVLLGGAQQQESPIQRIKRGESPIDRGKS